MQNKWIIYGFLTTMVIALTALAVLQYQWLGSISEAEEDRLEESLSAASENFVSDFNEVFEVLGQNFRISLDDPNDEIVGVINEAYQDWLRFDEYTSLVKDIYVIRPSILDVPNVYVFRSDPAYLEQINPDPETLDWISNNYKVEDDGSVKTPLRIHPDFGDQSFLSVPIQHLDMIEVERENISTKVEVRLSIDRLDDLVLIKLNDEIIKNEVIPDIANTYLTDSYEDRYHVSIVNDEKDRYVYYTNSEDPELDPDFRTPIDQFNLRNILIFQSDHSFNPLRLPQRNDSLDVYISEEADLSTWNPELAQKVKEQSETQIISQAYSSTTINLDSTFDSVTTDTTITSTFSASMNSSVWEFWLSFKEGSLSAYVAKTRNRNLAISFGILLILGISGGMIVVFLNRSRQLAEQQMLFVAGVSHELRTPLSVIRSAAENLTEGVVQTERRKKEYANLMLKEGRRLSDMVDQIMEFSGIQTGKKIYNFGELRIQELIQDLQDEVGHLLDEKRIQLELSNLSKQDSIHADRDALFLAISNLIKNAIKFSDSESTLILKLEDRIVKGDTMLQVEVQDFGIGIPEEEQHEIFKPFFRGKEAIDDQIKGNGIGLNLVKRVAEAHKGEVTVKSKLGEGSTFKMVIPTSNE